ncbi:AbfB domain-containing protein [Actinoplanes sp. NEAU-A12]|uniref:AbfB domain-containing protein n=1 Tax=Actinoplanes sandaracinus TaxID=3045177 RepID=A0ABT6WBU3_9ACTN|nr:AbfB domain-containing protein [Actinoplanes sandaracinus]MDI6097188.1 AbfB domain-containing protein [Actinoplanes sandaracinus]
MPEDDTRSGLRVGGWIPPYAPGGNPAAPIRPTVRPAPNAPRNRDAFPRLRGEGSMRPRLVLAAALCLACAATAAIAVILDSGRSPEPVAAEFTFPAGAAPQPPLTPDLGSTNAPASVEPSPPPSAAAAITTTPARAYSSPPPRSPAATRTTVAPTRTATTEPVTLTVGSTAGLESADHPGQRLRHRNFRGRLDPIGPASSAGDRADSGFRVRSGLAGSGCVSLESVNFAGYFVRHRNFEIRLERNDGSPLFQQDATFCPVTIRQGAALALRSTNYPQHHVVAADQWLRLAQTSAEHATAFTPRPAL